jgi:hypothetical protein
MVASGNTELERDDGIIPLEGLFGYFQSIWIGGD